MDWSSLNPNDIILAILGTVTAYYSWRGMVHAKKGRADMATNHGKRGGEYLEMIGELKSDVASLDKKSEEHTKALEEHTAHDAVNFAAIMNK